MSIQSVGSKPIVPRFILAPATNYSPSSSSASFAPANYNAPRLPALSSSDDSDSGIYSPSFAATQIVGQPDTASAASKPAAKAVSEAPASSDDSYSSQLLNALENALQALQSGGSRSEATRALLSVTAQAQNSPPSSATSSQNDGAKNGHSSAFNNAMSAYNETTNGFEV